MHYRWKRSGASFSNGKRGFGVAFWGIEKDNEEIPDAALPPYNDIEASNFVMPIDVFPELVKNEIESKAVKKH